MTTPRFFYFDLGNVLLAFDHRRGCANIARVANVSEDAVWRFVFEDDLQVQYETGTISDEAFHAAFCEATNSNPPLPELLIAASDIFEKQPEVVAIAERLRRQTDQMGVLSNTCKAHWEFVADRFPEVISPFEVYALSYELFSMKPAPEIYIAAAILAGREPKEIFFVDDREENIAAALAAGYDAVQFTTAQQLASDLNKRGMDV